MTIRSFTLIAEVDENLCWKCGFDSSGLTPQEIYGYVETIAARMRCDLITITPPIFIKEGESV